GVEVGPDLDVADLEQTEAQRLSVRALEPVVATDLELEIRGEPVARKRAHQLLTPFAVRLGRRDLEGPGGARFQAEDGVLERGEQLTGADHHRHRPTQPGRV